MFLYLVFGKIGTPGQKIVSILSFALVAPYGSTVVYFGGLIHVRSGELLEKELHWQTNSGPFYELEIGNTKTQMLATNEALCWGYVLLG